MTNSHYDFDDTMPLSTAVDEFHALYMEIDKLEKGVRAVIDAARRSSEDVPTHIIAMLEKLLDR